MKNIGQAILFILIIVGIPIVASFIVEAIANVITIDMIMTIVYIAIPITFYIGIKK